MSLSILHSPPTHPAKYKLLLAASFWEVTHTRCEIWHVHAVNNLTVVMLGVHMLPHEVTVLLLFCFLFLSPE